MLLVVSMILSSIRFDYVGDVFAADAETTSDTVTVGTPSEAEEAEAILEGEEAADKNQTELVVDEERENEEERENVEEVEDDSAKVLVVDDPSTDYSITINAPEGSLPYPEEELSVTSREILPGTDGYNMYLNCAADALNKDDTETISFARFFDIEILRNGEKIEPALPVEVKIEYENAPEVADSEDLSIVHFASSGIEVIDDVELNNDASEITYEQDSFSVTATIITDSGNVDPIEQGHRYALVAQVGSDYYVVNYDGSLKKVSKTGDDIKADDLYMWTYVEVEGKNYLRFVNEGYDYNTNDLPETYGYTYIDPGVNSGLSVDVPKAKTSESEKTSFDTRLGSCYLSFTNDGCLKLSDENKYLSVDSQVKKIIGNSTDGGSAKFFLANASNFRDCLEMKEVPPHNTYDYGMEFYRQNQIDHIDISVEDTVVAKIPLAYGKYYNSNGEEVLTVKEYTDISVSKDLDVNQDLLRNAKIIATDKNGNILDDAFCITGYSSNPKDNSDNSTQVRIEGMFKVSAGTLPEPNRGNTDNNKAYNLNNPIYYSLYATQKNVTFPYIYPGIGQLYDAKGNALSITTDVDLKLENMYYFDFQNNRCPVINGNMAQPPVKAAWREGAILNSGTSGMDYVIKGETDIQLRLRRVAINVSNDLRDSNGNIIKPKDEYNNIRFNVIQNYNGDSDSVKDVNIGSHITDVDLRQYNDNSHDITSYIDKTGSGLTNDYEVFDGMVNVKEDIDTVPKVVVDQDGNTWLYRYSYIETENVNRGDGKENLLHVGDQSSIGMAVATPEVLGDYTDINSGDRFSEFVEFFAHNVYDKVIPPTKEEVSPYQGNGELGGVCAGDQITYSINYTNYSSSAEDIVIKDKLDENVEFVSASNGGTESDGVVTWNLDSVPAGQKGSVTLTVKVLETALESNGGPGTVINGGDTATVQVGNDPVFTLDEVLNPVTMPSKTEVSPYEGNGLLGNVTVGEEIVYEITYKNYKDSAATVVIKDLLDKNVEFVSATNGGVNNNGTVVWTLKDVPAGQIGTVNLTVKVLEGALASNGGPGSVINGGMGDPSHGGISNKYGATVQVGDDKEVGLDQVENPVVLEPVKQEVAPYAGTGKLGEVNVGDEITYEIVYTNYKNKPVDVTIADLFDKNLKFISASDGGEYDAEEHGVSWKIKDVPAGKTGKVTVTVKVLEGALKSKNGPGNVINGGFEEPESNYSFTLVVIDDDLFILDPVENPVKEPAATVTTPAKTAAPAKTGDKMPILPVACVMIIAIVGIVTIARKRRKVND